MERVKIRSDSKLFGGREILWNLSFCAAPKIEGGISQKGASSQTHVIFGEWVT